VWYYVGEPPRRPYVAPVDLTCSLESTTEAHMRPLRVTTRMGMPARGLPRSQSFPTPSTA